MDSNGIFYKSKPNFESDLIAEKCQHHTIDVEIELDKSLQFYDKYISMEAKHGDIITTPHKYNRSLEVYFVNSVLIELEDNKGFMVERHLCQEDPTDSGYCCVPKDVTKKIKNPLKFYENAFQFKDYTEKDFSGIDIDTDAHQELISSLSGGRKVASEKKCFYFLEYNQWDSSEGLFIWLENESKFVKLVPELDQSYLA